VSDLARTPIAQNAHHTQNPAASGLLQRKCACGNHTVAGRECAECAKQKSGLQRKLAIGASDDPLEREADRVADTIVNGGRTIQPVTAPATNLPVQRQPDDAQKPREQPTTFPVEEQPKHGQEKEDEEKEKLKTGGLKAAGEFAKLLWDGFSTSQFGMQILAQNERDWKPVIKFFEDFTATWVGKIILGSAAGGAMTGAFLGARSARDENVLPDPSLGGSAKLLVPKDEKFFALELNWDFISPPSGVTIKTPWLDLPKIGGAGAKGATSTTLPPAPTLIKPMLQVPKICTPADPRGDRGEADARSAQIYSWLLWKQQQDAEKMNELLRKYTQPIRAPGEIWRPGQPYSFKQSQLSTIKPLFKRSDGAPEVIDPQAIDAGLQSSAHPLDPALRAEMETHFGYDFSRVRVHTDQVADRSAKAVNALAYTVGPHVVFGSSQYAPTTSAGRRLLAHELTHVVQQSGLDGFHVGQSDEKRGLSRTSFAVEVRRPVMRSAVPGVLQRQQLSSEELRKRLEQVRHDLSTGSGVRTTEATNKLKEEEQRLMAALGQTAMQDLRRRLEANRQQQAVGTGVRSPEAIAKLKEDQQQIETQIAITASAGGAAPTFFKPSGAPQVANWAGGNLRGLGAEDAVLNASYPGATKLPAGYPGVDFIHGGQRTPLTGFGRGQAGKLPLSSDSVVIDGGTLVQLKTMKNSLPYYQEPNAVLKELEKGLEGLANIKPGAGKSEQVGAEYRRVEHSGQATKKILHVELEAPPTPEQQAQLARLKDSGKSYGAFGPGEEIEVVVNWPGGTPKSIFSRIEMAPGSAMGAANLGLAVAGAVGRERLRERQLETEGYAPVGLAAHGSDSFWIRLGAFFRGDQAESLTGATGTLNMPVWRNNLRQKAEAKKTGETLMIGWQYKDPTETFSFTEDIAVTYQKQPDGSWRALPPSDKPKGFTVPDLNRIIDLKESDGAVLDMLSSEKGA
jgi:hypothetical protein